MIALQVPAVQTGLASFATSKLEKNLDGDISIGAIRILPFNTLIVDDVTIVDKSPSVPGTDTLASIGHLSATFSLKSLFRKTGFDLGSVKLQDVQFQLVSVKDSLYSSNLARVFRLKGNPDAKMTLDSLFTIHELSVKNARYRMLNPGTNLNHKHGINYSDMDVTFDAEAHDVGFSGGRCRAVVDHLNAREKSGFEIFDASGSCRVGQGETLVTNLHLVDNGGSDMHFSKVLLSYDNTEAWSDFVNKVDLDVHIDPSHLVLGSISGYSGGSFYGNAFTADISKGRFKGTVSDFTVSDFSFVNPAGGASGTINANCSGIPDTDNMYLDAKLGDVRFTADGLEAALKELGVAAKIPPLAKGAVFALNGTASGLLNDFKGDFNIDSPMGSAKASAHARHLVDQSKDANINAMLTTSSLDLGKILGNSTLGPCDLSAKLNAGFGRSGFKAEVEDINISRLNVLGYDYSGLSLDGGIKNGIIDARINSTDPGALLNLDAFLDLSNESGRINAELRNVDLAALNIDTRGGASKVSCTIYGEQGIEKKAPAHVHISDLVLTNDDGPHRVGDIDLEAREDEDLWTLILNSECLDMKYYGPSDFASLINDVKLASVEKAFPDYFASGNEPKGNEATVSVVFHDASPILAFVMPDLQVAGGTTANLNIDKSGRLLGYLSSPLIALNGISVNGIAMALDNQFDDVNITMDADKIRLNNMTFDKAQFVADAALDKATMSLSYAGADILGKGSELNLEAELHKGEEGKPELNVSTLPSYLSVKDLVWEMSRSNIFMQNGSIQVNGFNLSSDSQSIALNGRISPDSKDQLQMVLHNLDLGVVNAFMPEGGLQLEGILDGYASVLSPVPSEFGLSANLALDDLKLWGREAGNIRLISDWDDAQKLINYKLTNTSGDEQILRLTGNYGIKSKVIDASLGMDGFDAGLAAPVLKSVLSELSGKLYGTVKAHGRLDKPVLSSEGIRLVDLRTRVAYTNVAYIMNGTLGLNDKGLQFNGIGVKDEYGGLGVLNGSLGFKELKNFKLDANLDMYKLKAIDIPVKGSSALYGDLAVTGNGRISGPFNALHIDADLATAGAGNVNVPIPSSSAASGSDLLTFVTPEVEQEEGSQKAAGATPVPAPKNGKLSIHAKMGISPEVIANVEIDKESGHVLTAGGNGSVVLDLDTSRDIFQLKGDYIINQGKYLFNIPGIVSKEFEIRDGSSLKFNGDIMESTLDINALHNVKTSLSTLVADSTAVSSRRNVECGLRIGGRLKNPEVSFSINVPDLEPHTKTQVDAALNTNDKIQKQFVALLLFGTFLPEESSGVVNGTNMILANVGEIVSGQLNNILQKMEIPLDFGFGYQQDNGGTDIFDVAVSTQLFNNRIVVNGSLGNRKYCTSTSAYGDVVGDLDIGYKVLNSGELILKLFSHSADEYTSSLDYSQRNGGGITYQKEYNKTLDFLRSLFMNKRRKAQEELKEAERKKQMKVIHISE